MQCLFIYLTKIGKRVRVGRTVRKEMKRKSRSITKTLNQSQSRTVKCYFDCNADGIIAVISITDRLFTKRRTKQTHV